MSESATSYPQESNGERRCPAVSAVQYSRMWGGNMLACSCAAQSVGYLLNLNGVLRGQQSCCVQHLQLALPTSETCPVCTEPIT